MKDKKDVISWYNEQGANDELYKLRKNARGLEQTIQVIKQYAPHFNPDLVSFESIFQGNHATTRITNFILSEKKHHNSLERPGKDIDELRATIYRQVEDATHGMSKPIDWEYWFTIDNEGRVIIKVGYTGEIKAKHTYILTGNIEKAYRQAEAIVSLLNESRELLQYAGLAMIEGTILVNDRYQVNNDFFYQLVKR